MNMVLRSGVRGAGLALRSWAVTFFFISTVYGASSTFADVWVDDDWSNQVAGAVVDGHTFGTDAFATIQAGIDAVETGGVVWVAAGAYSAGADVGSKPLALRALAGAGQTIINGSIGAELITSGELVVDGFTIHGTRAVSATDSSVAVSNCVLKADNTSGVYGWGVYLVRSSAKIVRNVIGDVQPSVLGGVPPPSFFFTPFMRYSIYPGAILFWTPENQTGASLACEITDNKIGGTISFLVVNPVTNGAFRISNNIIAGAILACPLRAPSFEMINNTIVQGGIGVRDTSAPTLIRNNIITESSVGIQDLTGTAVIDHNCIWYCGADYVDVPSQLGVNGNIGFNPKFADRVAFDFRLDDHSPCIGAGTADAAPTLDLEQNPRPSPDESPPDIGAYENSRETPLSAPREIIGRYQMVLIADSRDFPEFEYFPMIAMNNAGQIAIGTGKSILVGDGKTIHRINVAASAISINDSGVVACAGTVAGTTGIYVAEGTNITAIAVQGDTFADFGWPSINNAGAVAFSAAPLSGWRGIYLADNTGTHLLYPPTTELYYDLLPRSLNNAGTIAFWAIPQVAYPHWQELLVGNGGTPQRVAKRGGDGIVDFGFSCSINDAGQIAFPVTMAHDHAALFLGAAGQSPTLVVDEGGAFISDGFPFLASINNAGEIVFNSEIKSLQEGVFTSKDIQRDTVIHDDVVLFGSTMSGIRYFGGQNFNDAGQVALPISFYDGRFVVVRADPLLPENLSIVSLKAPKRLKMGGASTSRTGLIKVVLQNGGRFEGTIPNLAALTNLVSTAVESIGGCPSPEARLDAAPSFPIRWPSLKKLRLRYRVEFDCVNDPLPTAHGSSDHADYRVKVYLNSPTTDLETLIDMIGN